MSIEEMIRVLEGEEEYLWSWHKEAIVEALKAGQALYKGYTILERQARQCGFLDSRDHEKLLQAYDAALKGEKEC
jgi:hypothetical protein